MSVLRLLRFIHLRWGEEATVSIVTGFLLCYFILMDVPSPWVRSCEYVFFSLFHYKSFTLSRVILGMFPQACLPEASSLGRRGLNIAIFNEEATAFTVTGFLFFSSLWSCEYVVISLQVFHSWVKSSLVSVSSYFSSLRSPGNSFYDAVYTIHGILLYLGYNWRL